MNVEEPSPEDQAHILAASIEVAQLVHAVRNREQKVVDDIFKLSRMELAVLLSAALRALADDPCMGGQP